MAEAPGLSPGGTPEVTGTEWEVNGFNCMNLLQPEGKGVYKTVSKTFDSFVWSQRHQNIFSKFSLVDLKSLH